MQAFSEREIYDYIICGGGCAGLSLAYQINLKPELKEKKILILESENKNTNDRTWCFWEKTDGPFQEIIHHQWNNAWFYGPTFSRLLDLNPYSYKMIKADRFYLFTHQQLASNSNIVFKKAKVSGLKENPETTVVQTNLGSFEGKYIFNSIPAKGPKKENYHYLLQHFKGWVIKTEKPSFNPLEPVLMDFRIKQESQCRFMYVLPTSEYEALVEFTIFSENHLPDAEYDLQIRQYIQDYLKIEIFSLVHEEFGSIPMFSEPFLKKKGNRIINIGTAGGQTKASTGYTFTRIQRHSQFLADNLATTGNPEFESKLMRTRFELYDNVLLHVIAKNVVGGAKVFQNLFRYNKPAAIFRFLDEDTHFLQEYRLLNTVPIFKFIGPGWKELLNLGK